MIETDVFIDTFGVKVSEVNAIEQIRNKRDNFQIVIELKDGSKRSREYLNIDDSNRKLEILNSFWFEYSILTKLWKEKEFSIGDRVIATFKNAIEFYGEYPNAKVELGKIYTISGIKSLNLGYAIKLKELPECYFFTLFENIKRQKG